MPEVVVLIATTVHNLAAVLLLLGIVGHLIALVDDAGAATAELAGIEFAAVDPGSLPTSLDQMTFNTEWVEAPLAAGQAAPGS